MKPVKETTFSSKIHKALFANIRNDYVFSVIKIRNTATQSEFGHSAADSLFIYKLTGKHKLYTLHRNRKRVLNMQVYYFFSSMCILYGVCAI